MSRKFLTAIDLAKNELQNGVIQNLASAPSSPVKGQLYFDSTGNVLYWWNGTAWVSAAGGTVAFGAVPAETTFGIAKNDGVATTAARSDHTHGSPTHDAAAHSTIPISALAAAAADVSMGGNEITNVGTPVNGSDAANKSYVDNAIAGLAWKDAVKVATTADSTLTGNPVIDGVSTANGDRVLVKNQTAPAQNGIYVVATGAWTRASDADLDTELLGAAVFVSEGATQGDTSWVMTTSAPITVGTSPMAWSQFAGPGVVSAGAGMTQSGNTLNVIGDATMTVAADSLGVANDGVTNAKLANVGTNTIKGRATAGTGDPEDLSPSQVALVLAGSVARLAAFNSAAATSTACVHNFGTRDVIVGVHRNSTPWDTIDCDVERTDGNTVTVRFAAAVTASEYRILVHG